MKQTETRPKKASREKIVSHPPSLKASAYVKTSTDRTAGKPTRTHTDSYLADPSEMVFEFHGAGFAK